jgi:ribosomal protein S18 acetylase RimI-like enzyme
MTDIAIGRLGLDDVPAAGAVLDAAFGRQGMIGPLSYVYVLQPENCVCARLDGAVLATVGAYCYGPFASIGMMAVRPDVLCQGLGRRLMAYLIKYLAGQGYAALCLEASAAGAHLYPKLSFLPGGQTLRMSRPAPSSDANGLLAGRPAPPTPPAVTLRTFTPADLPAVVAHDGRVFGVARPAVLRSYHARQPQRCFVALDTAGAVAGYIIAGTSTLGPWMARSVAIAEALLRTALALPFDSGPRLTLPAQNADGLALLARYGFVATETLTHMRLGGDADPRQHGQYYAQASLGLG